MLAESPQTYTKKSEKYFVSGMLQILLAGKGLWLFLWQ